MIFVELYRWSMQSQYVKVCHFSMPWSLTQSSNYTFFHKGQTPKIPNHVQVNFSKALPKIGTIEDTFTSASQTWRNRSAHLTQTWIWTKMHCSTFTCGATTFTSTEPLQFCIDWKSWNEERQERDTKTTELQNDKPKNLNCGIQNNQLWQTQFSQVSRETRDIFFLVCLVQFVHCQCDSWAPQHWDELLHDPTYSLQLGFG